MDLAAQRVCANFARRNRSAESRTTKHRKNSYGRRGNFDGFIARALETGRGRVRVLACESPTAMKNDPLFKFVAVTIVAALLVALLNSTHALHVGTTCETDAPHVVEASTE